MDKTSFISSLETFIREVNTETEDAQIASIARVFAKYEAPLFIEAGLSCRVLYKFTRMVRQSKDDQSAAEIARKFASSSVPTMLRNLKKEMRQSGKTA